MAHISLAVRHPQADILSCCGQSQSKKRRSWCFVSVLMSWLMLLMRPNRYVFNPKHLVWPLPWAQTRGNIWRKHAHQRFLCTSGARCLSGQYSRFLLKVIKHIASLECWDIRGWSMSWDQILINAALFVFFLIILPLWIRGWLFSGNYASY